ncbi:MAG TPA: class I SAM-dependent methyltransferase [Candidatus Binatia bacterium]|nr:class I SAM-dependent methyltransferase [Candidatus Binatia bacterium]
MVRGCRVLDGACGTGYGTSLLRRAGADYVEGVDLSEESINEAESLYRDPGIRFRRGDLLSLEVPDASFDVIVSFESIEHVNDDAQYAREMRRALKPGGVFLCSTPNRTVTNPGTEISARPYNPYHVREYTGAELRQKLALSFGNVTMLGQMPWSQQYCAFLAAVARASPMLAVRMHQTRKALRSPFDRKAGFFPATPPARSEPEGLVAICS